MEKGFLSYEKRARKESWNGELHQQDEEEEDEEDDETDECITGQDLCL